MTSKDYNEVREEIEFEKGKLNEVEIEEMEQERSSIKQSTRSRRVNS